MKRVVILLSYLICFSSVAVKAQVFSSEDKDKISEAKKQMDQNELSQMTEAETNFEEAQFALESVSSEEYKVDQSFSKGASAKNEKKAVNVKHIKVDAGKKNEKGFTGMYEAMESRLNRLPFNTENKAKAKDLRAQAADKMAAGTTAIEDYKYRDDKDLETYPYATLKDKIALSNSSFKEAIMLDLQAFELFKEQTLSITSVEPTSEPTSSPSTTSSQPEVAATATTESSSSGVVVETSGVVPESNTSATVNTQTAEVSVTTTPEPAPVQEPAPAPVQELAPAPTPVAAVEQPVAKEQPALVKKQEPSKVSKPAKAERSSTPVATKPKAAAKTASAPAAKMPETGGVVYRVQIIAVSKGQLSEAATKKLYSGSEKIYEEQEGGYYKYCVGDFSSVSQAQQLKESMSGDCFVVKYVNGKRQ